MISAPIELLYMTSIESLLKCGLKVSWNRRIQDYHVLDACRQRRLLIVFIYKHDITVVIHNGDLHDGSPSQRHTMTVFWNGQL